MNPDPDSSRREPRGTVVVLLRVLDGTGSSDIAEQYTGALAAAGYTVHLLYGERLPGDQPLPTVAREMLERLREAGLVLHPFAHAHAPLALQRRLRELCRQQRPEAVIAFQQADRGPAFLAGLVNRVPTVLSILNMHRFHGRTASIKEALYRVAVRRADTSVACSDAVATELRDRFGVGADRLRLVPNGLDVASFSHVRTAAGQHVRDELGLADDQLLLLNVGRLDEQKGQDLLIDAFQRVGSPKMHLGLVGATPAGKDASFEAGLRAQVAAGAKVTITMLGWRDDFGVLLEACDVYVSASRWEGWSMALVGAMAAARPLIMTDCAGWPVDFVNGTHGQVVPSNSVDELAGAIASLDEHDPDDLRTMGQRCRELAQQHYDSNVTKTQFVRVVDEVTGAPDQQP